MLNLLRKFLSWLKRDPIVIHLYYTFRNKNKIYFKGRILQNRLIVSRPSDKALMSLVKFIRRLLTNEQRNKNFNIQVNGQDHQYSTDKEGYFEMTVPVSRADAHQVVLSTKHAKVVLNEIEEIGQDVDFGIISDIDDTIMRTGVASKFKWRLFINTLFINPWRRESFAQTSELFQELTVAKGDLPNPIFYISNSPWNIYYYLEDYLTSNGFPKGPLMLRDINFSWFNSKEVRQQNKYLEICKILNICTELTFILIGDSGELDTDIYSAINIDFPGRVKAIYIRDIPKSKRMDEIKEIITQMNGKGLLFTESHEILSDIAYKNRAPKTK